MGGLCAAMCLLLIEKTQYRLSFDRRSQFCNAFMCGRLGGNVTSSIATSHRSWMHWEDPVQRCVCSWKRSTWQLHSFGHLRENSATLSPGYSPRSLVGRWGSSSMVCGSLSAGHTVIGPKDQQTEGPKAECCRASKGFAWAPLFD